MWSPSLIFLISLASSSTPWSVKSRTIAQFFHENVMQMDLHSVSMFIVLLMEIG
jgi:hypothetical protein